MTDGLLSDLVGVLCITVDIVDSLMVVFLSLTESFGAVDRT